MKRHLLSISHFLAFPLAVFFFLTGCQSMSPEKAQVIASIVGQAANFGAQAYLASHPEARPAFDAAIALLGAFQRGGSTNQVQLAEALSHLPDVLQADEAGKELYVADVKAGKLVLFDQDTKKAQRLDGPLAKPAIRELRRGLARAVGPRVPVPAGALLLPGFVPTGAESGKAGKRESGRRGSDRHTEGRTS